MIRRSLALAVALLPSLAASADATTLLGLAQDGKSIVTIDLEQAKVVSTKRLQSPPTLAMDYSAQDNVIYAYASNDMVRQIFLPGLDQGGAFSAGFKTDVDEISVGCNALPNGVQSCQFVSAAKLNVNFNTSDGETVKFPRQTYQKGAGAPRIVGASFDNSVVGARTTRLIEIDAARDAMFEQVDQTKLKTIGALGLKIEGSLAFDILSSSDGSNRGYMVYKRKLRTVDLKTGKAGRPKAIKGLNVDLRDMTFAPSQ